MILINKPRGLTPLQALDQLRVSSPEFSSSKLAYAGRLDPQAEGLLLVLVDDECKSRDEFQNLDKVYEFELLLGVSTDTGDLMGIPTPGKLYEVNKADVENILNKFKGKITQQYPTYSSKTIDGKAMYKLAREGRAIAANHEIEIYELRFLEQYSLSSIELKEFIHKNINRVTGEFRQPQILEAWNALLEKQTEQNWQVFKMWAHVSSGTYIRQLCLNIGEVLGTSGTALSIKRIKIGEFTSESSQFAKSL